VSEIKPEVPYVSKHNGTGIITPHILKVGIDGEEWPFSVTKNNHVN
jgi:hypothetical protein